MAVVLHIWTDAGQQAHLLSDLLPFGLQHLLLLVGVIDDVLPANQQLALHRLGEGKQNQACQTIRLATFPKAAVRPE